MKENTLDELMVREHYRSLTEMLIERGLTITTMESITSGQIASLITDTEGASAVLKGAYVTYSNEAKILQGVPREVIDKYSVYSMETAEAMAEACRKSYGADIGIGVTGTAGNRDPANPESSVPGEVYFAVSLKGEMVSQKRTMGTYSARQELKFAIAEEVFQTLKKLLGTWSGA